MTGRQKPPSKSQISKGFYEMPQKWGFLNRIIPELNSQQFTPSSPCVYVKILFSRWSS